MGRQASGQRIRRLSGVLMIRRILSLLFVARPLTRADWESGRLS